VYTDNIVVSSNSVANPNVVIPVTLTVSNASNFVSNPSSLTFNYQIGQGQQSPSSTITLSSTGAPLQFNATATTTSCGNFILLNPASGTTSPSAGVNGTQIQVVTSGIASLTTPVVCNGSINVTSTSGANLTVPVKVNVVNTPVLNLGTSAITQSAAVGSTTQMKVQVSVTATDNASHLSYSATAATNPAGQTWLTVTPQVGQVTPANVTVTLDPTNLPAGTYTGSITITDLTPNSPVPTQTIPVTFIVAAPVSVDHTSLTFSVNQGGPAPVNQTLTVSGVPPGVTIGATATTSTCGTGWLTSTVSANTVTVAITPTGLQQSASPCTGQISIVVPGAPNSPLIVPVTVNVGAPLALSLSATTANFTYTVGSSTTPAAQNVNLSATGGAAVPFTVSAATQSGGNWLTVTPTSGNTGSTPVALMIGLNSTVVSTLGPGSYQGTVTVASTSIPNGSVTINVTLTVSAPPVAAIVSIVNAATQLPGPVAPGELVTLYGTNLGPTTGVTFTPTANGTVPTTLGGAQVFFDNTPAPIIYAGANQINAIVPYEVAGRLQTNITVSRNNTTSMAIIQMVASTSPGIFTQDASGRGAGSILNQDYSLNGPAHPAPKGSVIAIYATGEGTLNPPVATGSITGSNAPFPKPNAAVTAYFLVQQANGSTVQVPAGIEYAGEAPTLVAGVLQVNIDVPSSVPSGAQTVVIMVGSNSSPSTVTAYIQ
jgi:uncharacterized protein (TIGR03437 family)